MKRICLLLALSLLLGCLSGCAQTPAATPESEIDQFSAVPPDGDPKNVTCKGSYTGTPDAAAIAAWTEDTALTLEALQVWYWAEVAAYRQAGTQPAPEDSLPLDRQSCPIDSTVNSWQQYFLKRALTAWHTSQALIRQSETQPLPIEDAHRPNQEVLEKYLEGMPAAEFLYGYRTHYRPNTMHQAYLNSLPDTLEALARSKGFPDTDAMARSAFGSSRQALLAYAQDRNLAYMYFTTLSYGLEEAAPRSEESDPGASRVTFRHILLLPEDSTPDSWAACEEEANALLTRWAKDRKASESTFAQLAFQHSRDPGSASDGGEYRQVAEEQLSQPLRDWCFQPLRAAGDTAVLRGETGIHILYFCGRENDATLSSQALALSRRQQALLAQARADYPMETDFSAIVLAEAQGNVSAPELLYPDVAHERFPEVPLYLQQSYPDTDYGDYPITTNGCGITSLAMIASYLADDELTPPEMCARYGAYSSFTGTAGNLFEEAPAQLGFYLVMKTYDWRVARDYMKLGHQVVVVQYRGYWTRGGHYLVLEELSEDGLVRVRDSNMYNYAKLVRHKEDLFPWDTLSTAGMGYWVFAPKATTNASCTRCGDPEALDITFVTDYLCKKCQTAQLRRESFLS